MINVTGEHEIKGYNSSDLDIGPENVQIRVNLKVDEGMYVTPGSRISFYVCWKPKDAVNIARLMLKMYLGRWWRFKS